MSDPDRDDVLWELLGKARPTKVSPFFARNVLRRLREQEQDVRPGLFARILSQHRRWAALAASLAVIAAASAVFPRVQKSPVPEIAQIDATEAMEPVTEQIAASPDYELIVQLDELLAYEKNTLWIDDSATF